MPALYAASAKAHPRSRGENLNQSMTEPTALWLIPAHAGKTASCTGLCPTCRAHPRSRGENHVQARAVEPENGSSPLTRGKPCGGRGGRGLVGLIPAHAGKTRGPHTASMTAGAHPRSRGENVQAVDRFRGHAGSSPLTRGKRRSMRSPRSIRLAHPRSRGENAVTLKVARETAGSSPLTRGKRARCRRARASLRLIPAHAGKTRSH